MRANSSGCWNDCVSKNGSTVFSNELNWKMMVYKRNDIDDLCEMRKANNVIDFLVFSQNFLHLTGYYLLWLELEWKQDWNDWKVEWNDWKWSETIGKWTELSEKWTETSEKWIETSGKWTETKLQLLCESSMIRWQIYFYSWSVLCLLMMGVFFP